VGTVQIIKKNVRIYLHEGSYRFGRRSSNFTLANVEK